jgi:hypothetical protein
MILRTIRKDLQRSRIWWAHWCTCESLLLHCFKCCMHCCFALLFFIVVSLFVSLLFHCCFIVFVSLFHCFMLNVVVWCRFRSKGNPEVDFNILVIVRKYFGMVRMCVCVCVCVSICAFNEFKTINQSNKQQYQQM